MEKINKVFIRNKQTGEVCWVDSTERKFPIL
jgi:hypothetical protein